MARIKVTPNPEASTYFIDATNICHWGKEMSLQVLLQLLLEIKRKKQTFFCIFDANTSYYIPDNEKKIYKKLLEHTDRFYQVSGGKRADDFILELAHRHGSAVISNDNYSDPKYSKYKWKEREAEPMRLFMGEVIPVPSGDHLILFDLEINIILTESTDKLYRKLTRILYPPREKFEGTVKFVNNHKGWGRIVYQIEDEVNFRTSELPQTVEQGQRVNFFIDETEKGEYARSIDILEVDEKRIKGKIVQFDDNRGMGAIKPEEGGGEDLFFYKSYFDDPENVPKINKNQRVSYVLGSNSKGECAKKIKFEAEDPRDVQIKLLKDRTKYLEDKLRSREDEIKRLKQGGSTQPAPADRSKDNAPQRPSQKSNKPEQKSNNKEGNSKQTHQNDNADKPQNKQQNKQRRNEESGDKRNNQPKKEAKVVLKKSKKPSVENLPSKEASNKNKNTKPNADTPSKEEQVSKEATVKTDERQAGKSKEQNERSQDRTKPNVVRKSKKYIPKSEETTKPELVEEVSASKPQDGTKPELVKEEEVTTAKVEQPKTEERTKPKLVKKSKDAKAETQKVEEKPVVKAEKEPQADLKNEGAELVNAQQVEEAKTGERTKPKLVRKSKKEREQDKAAEQSVTSEKEEVSTDSKAKEVTAAKTEERTKPKLVRKPKKEREQLKEDLKAQEGTIEKVEEKTAPNAEEMPKNEPQKEVNKKEGDTQETSKPQKTGSSSKANSKRVKPLPKKRTQVASKTKNDEEKQYSNWWKSLEKQWQMAFNVVAGNGEIVARPSNAQIKNLLKIKRLSFYRTSKNKLSFKLTNMTGLRDLTELQTLNIAEHEISNLRGTDKLAKLHTLNCNKNQLKNLKGIESMKMLRQFSCVGNELQFNNFANIVKRLPSLTKLDARNNRLSKDDKKKIQEATKGIVAKF